VRRRPISSRRSHKAGSGIWNPGLAAGVFFGFPDACGSYDWNCDGRIEQQQQCSYHPSLACGGKCTVNSVFGGTLNLFTESCH
jgi:hypothetical protein